MENILLIVEVRISSCCRVQIESMLLKKFLFLGLFIGLVLFLFFFNWVEGLLIYLRWAVVVPTLVVLIQVIFELLLLVLLCIFLSTLIFIKLIARIILILALLLQKADCLLFFIGYLVHGILISDSTTTQTIRTHTLNLGFLKTHSNIHILFYTLPENQTTQGVVIGENYSCFEDFGDRPV